jgi:MFS family permease
VVGVSPATAGIALIPATIPIILAGPLAGRAFDRMGGRWPLVAGFTVLAASGVVLALSVSSESATALIPGLLLQGLGLGIVLTVNDPTGLTAVPPQASGQAAGMINTAEQLGGAVGIAGLTAIELGINFHQIYSRLAARGIHPTPAQNRQAREFVVQAEQKGLHNVSAPPAVKTAIHDLVTAHVIAFQWTFSVSAGIALLGAIVALVLVRRSDRIREGPIFARRPPSRCPRASRSCASTSARSSSSSARGASSARCSASVGWSAAAPRSPRIPTTCARCSRRSRSSPRPLPENLRCGRSWDRTPCSPRSVRGTCASASCCCPPSTVRPSRPTPT